MIDRAFIKLLAPQIDLQGKCGRAVGEGRPWMGGGIWVAVLLGGGVERELNPEN